MKYKFKCPHCGKISYLSLEQVCQEIIKKKNKKIMELIEDVHNMYYGPDRME